MDTTTAAATTTQQQTTTISSVTTPNKPTTITTVTTPMKPSSPQQTTSSPITTTTQPTTTTTQPTTTSTDPTTATTRPAKTTITPYQTTSTTTPVVTTTGTTQTTKEATTRKPFNCTQTPNTFACHDESACLKNTQICDGKTDCKDNSDEEACPSNCGKCSKMDFKCHKTCQCISWYFVCDNDWECLDGSDEIGCPESNTTHPTTTQQTTARTTPVAQTTTTTKYVTTPVLSTTTTAATTKRTAPPTSQQTTTTPETTTKTTALPPMSCLNNHIFKSCMMTCQRKCAYLSHNCVEDSRTCSKGCGCPDNLLSNGTFCVLPAECACFDYDIGKFARPYESWVRGCVKHTCFNNTIRRSQVECQSESAPCPPPRRWVTKRGECCKVCVSGDDLTTMPPVTTTPTICRAGFFLCESNAKCISEEWLCDGERDCADASDEMSCNYTKPSCYDAIG